MAIRLKVIYLISSWLITGRTCDAIGWKSIEKTGEWASIIAIGYFILSIKSNIFYHKNEGKWDNKNLSTLWMDFRLDLYIKSRETALKFFLNNGHLEIDNNSAECESPKCDWSQN